MITTARVGILNDLLSSTSAPDVGKLGGHREVTCPTPALLSALAEEGVQNELGRSLWPHVSKCTACLDLYQRLSAFTQAERGDTSEGDLAWQSARPRLEEAIYGNSFVESRREAGPNRWFAWLFQLPRSAQWALSCSAILLTGALTWLFYTNGGDAPAEASRAPVAMPSVAPSVPANKDAKLNGSVSLARAHDANAKPDFKVSRSFVIDAGTPIKLQIDSVHLESNSVFAIEGRLTTSSVSATFEEAWFSGKLERDMTKCDLSIKQVTAGGVSYEVLSSPITAATVDATTGTPLAAGQVFHARLPATVKLSAVLR